MDLFELANKNLAKDRIDKIKAEVDKLTEKEAKIKLDKIYKIIEHNADLYYNKDISEISDFEYDMLIQETRFIEKKYPKLKKEKSLNNKVGGEAQSTFNKVTHEYKMQSLNDVFSFEEVEDFNITAQKNLKTEENIKYVVETKIDGLSASITYLDGKLVLGATRGNGIIGEDVTENIKTIADLPQEIEFKGKLILRGEIYVSKEEFFNLNQKRKSQLEEKFKDIEDEEEKLLLIEKNLFANARNIAAGTIRQKDVNIVRERNLKILIFNIQYIENIKFDSHKQGLEYIKKLGFTVNPYILEANNINQIKENILYIGNKRESLPFGIDGAVIKIDNLELREKLGETEKAPKWAVAYKYPPEQKITIVKDIYPSVSRTGNITPIGILEPVRVDGSIISKTTLHNYKYLQEKDIKIGDQVIIQKAGDVIPEIVEALVEKRTGKEQDVKLPNKCPICGSEVFINEDKTQIKCIGLECPAKQIKSIEHFASRNAMNIEGLAEKNIIALINEGKIHNISDLYYIKKEDIQILKKSGEKFADNLYNNIQKSKNNELHRLLFGLGIENIGLKSAKTISKKYKTLDNILQLTEEEITNIPDFGEITAGSIFKFFQNKSNIKIIEKLKKAGVNMIENIENISTVLEDLTFVITGSFDIPRKEIEEIIEQNGGKISSSVSKKTNYIIAGEDAGSKLKKAEELEIKIINLEMLKKLIETN